MSDQQTPKSILKELHEIMLPVSHVIAIKIVEMASNSKPMTEDEILEAHEGSKIMISVILTLWVGAELYKMPRQIDRTATVTLLRLISQSFKMIDEFHQEQIEQQLDVNNF